ncbi:MAG: MFS transporter [Actinomycetes bacterium]
MSFAADFRIVWRQPGFRRLYATRLLSQAADGCFQVALGTYVFFNPDQATTTAKAAAAFTVLLLPYSIVGPFAGVFLDRWSRQRVLARTNLLRAFIVVCVALMVADGWSGWLFFVAALIVISLNRFVLSALSAALPHVVVRDELVMGNSVSTTSGTVVALLGGGVGLAVRSLTGRGNAANAAVLLVAATVYVASSLAARTIGTHSLGPDLDEARASTRTELRNVAYGMAAGARHVWQHREAGYALATITVHRFFWGLSTIATVLLYRNHFNAADDESVSGLALVVAAAGIGVVLAAWLTPIVVARVGKDRWIIGLLVGAAVVEITLVTPFLRATIVIAAVFLGLAAQGVKICVDTLVQQHVDDAYRGRVFSLYDVVFNVSFVAAAGVGVILLPMSGKSYVVVTLISLGYLAAGLGYRRTCNGMRRESGPALVQHATVSS